MARSSIQETVQDTKGRPISGAVITAVDTSAVALTLYANPTGGTTSPGTTNAFGKFEAFVDASEYDVTVTTSTGSRTSRVRYSLTDFRLTTLAESSTAGSNGFLRIADDSPAATLWNIRRDAANDNAIHFDAWVSADGWRSAFELKRNPVADNDGGSELIIRGKTTDQQMKIGQYAFGWQIFCDGGDSDAELLEAYVPKGFSVASSENVVNPFICVRDKLDGADVGMWCDVANGWAYFVAGNSEADGIPRNSGTPTDLGLRIEVGEADGSQNLGIEIPATGEIHLGQAGTLAAPALAFVSDPDVGFYRSGAQAIALAVSDGLQAWAADGGTGVARLGFFGHAPAARQSIAAAATDAATTQTLANSIRTILLAHGFVA